MTKPKARTSTTAVAEVTVRVRNLGSWGPDCNLDQVYRQAAEAARNVLTKALSGKDCYIVSEVKIQAITTDLENRS